MRYLSVCSGIEAATVAWHGLGWQPVGFSEIEPFPSAVLAHHYPTVPNLGDMTKYKEWNIEHPDLLVGGTPCQSFSVAGLRKGLEDPRGNLALVYCGILDHFRPRWFVWENVPGVLSSAGGRDFGSFLGALAQLGYGFAYRVLDAQWFGVAQRRRRVFVVGYLGDWRPAAAVLFESESLRRDTAPSREAGKKPAASLVPSVAGSLDTECGGGKLTHQSVANGHLIGTITARMFNALGARDVEEGAIMPIAIQDTRPIEKAQNGRGWNDDGTASTVDTHATQGVAQPVAIQGNLIGRKAGGPQGVGASEAGVMYTLTKADVHGVAQPVVGSLSCNTGPNGHDAGNFACNQAVDAGHVLPVNIYGGNKRPDRPEGGFYVRMDEDTSKTLDAASGLNPTCSQGGTAVMQAVAYRPQNFGDKGGGYVEAEITNTLDAIQGSKQRHLAAQFMQVRRLTPVECERLQGFPDNYTAIPWRGKTETPDGPRYKALGNSMAVPVMRWIGERIQRR